MGGGREPELNCIAYSIGEHEGENFADYAPPLLVKNQEVFETSLKLAEHV